MAAEDYINFDDWDDVDFFDEEELDCILNTGRLERAYREQRQVQYPVSLRELVDPRYRRPAGTPLGSLSSGQTFRFFNAVSPENVYMVIQSARLEELGVPSVSYVHLNTGAVYSSSPSKCVRVVPDSETLVVDRRPTNARV